MNTPVPSVLGLGRGEAFGPTESGTLAHRIKAASFLFQQKDLRTFLSLSWGALFGVADMVLLKLDLDSFRSEQFRRYVLTARPVEPRDKADFFDLDANGLTRRERRDVAGRLFMLQAGIRTCYVVQDKGGNACFLQWLIPFSENEKLHRVYGNWYPELHPGEALVEHAYVLPRYRRTGLFPCAIARILEIARASGVKRIVTFIPAWNSNSLSSAMRLGFQPFSRRLDRKFFGIRFRRTEPLNPSQHPISQQYLRPPD